MKYRKFWTVRIKSIEIINIIGLLLTFASECYYSINKFRTLKLKNGLTALLISDPIIIPTVKSENQTKKVADRETDVEKLGACSVCVDVG